MNTILLQKTYGLYNQLSQHIARFPKFERYGLGLKLDNSCLLLLEQIITAEQTTPVLKDKALLEASIKTEIIKIFLRLALEQKLIKETSYFAWSSMLIEIGRMIGGWKKSLRV
jgi:hypothetical protein